MFSSKIYHNYLYFKGNDETPVASYENAVTKQDAGHYELTQSGESQLPAEYTDLKVSIKP